MSNERLDIIKLVMEVRVRLSQRAKESLSAIQEKRPRNEVNTNIIDVCKELGDISGFCDKNTKRWVGFIGKSFKLFCRRIRRFRNIKNSLV